MGIAVIYWHTISACRVGVAPSLLCLYNTGMKVGHHTAYEKAMRVWSGAEAYSDRQTKLVLEPDDMEYAIAQYGLAYHPECPDRQKILTEIIARDDFWPCFSYLAAWNDLHLLSPDWLRTITMLTSVYNNGINGSFTTFLSAAKPSFTYQEHFPWSALPRNPYRVFISDLSCEHSFYTSCRVKRLFHAPADVFLINGLWGASGMSR